MKRLLPLAAVFVLLALSGIIQGLWTGRWGASGKLDAAAARCDRLAMNLGDWEGHATEVNSAQLALAEVVGHCSRRYVNRRTGQQVSILLVCGRPGPISVHTPDVCYAGAGYSVVSGQERYRPPKGAGAEFEVARFSKPGVAPDPLRIFWSWSVGGAFSVPENPRLTFARSGALYKLYVIRQMAKPDEPLDKDAAVDFLNVLLPELNKCLSHAT